jgi:hypothetical protein
MNQRLNGRTVAAEGLKWRVNRAVRASTLPPPSRLIMFVLSDMADARTAEIPEEHTPSQSELTDQTGLGAATVKRHLDTLEADGWVTRTRPTEAERVRGKRTRYRLGIGSAPAPSSTAHSEPRQGSHGAVAEPTASLGTARSEPRHGSERALSTAQSEPPSYIDDRNDQLHDHYGANDEPPTGGTLFDATADAAQPRGTTKKTPKPPKPSKHEKADALAGAYWERYKTTTAQSYLAVRGVIRTALANGNDRDDVARALDRLGREQRAISGGTLTTALGQLHTNGHINGVAPSRNMQILEAAMRRAEAAEQHPTHRELT